MTAVGARTRPLAACADYLDVDWWLSRKKAERECAIAICHTCPIEAACRDGAVARRQFDSVRGGLHPKELRVLAGTPSRQSARHNRTRYVSGKCDCSRCRAANAAYQRSYRARHVTRRGSVVRVRLIVLKVATGRGRGRAYEGQLAMEIGGKQ